MDMGMEGTMLLWSAVLGLVQILIASMAVNKDVGLPYNLSSRDEASPPVGKVAGRANIQAFMEKSLGTGPNRGGSYHIMSNFVITVTGDTATAWSRWTFVTPGERGAAIAQAGRYDDTFVRENGVWKFKRRVASNDTAPPGK